MNTNFGNITCETTTNPYREALKNARQYFKRDLYEEFSLQELSDEDLKKKFEHINKVTGLHYTDKLAQILCYICYDVEEGKFISDKDVLGLNIFNDCPEYLIELINNRRAFVTVEPSNSQPSQIVMKVSYWYKTYSVPESDIDRINYSLSNIIKNLEYFYQRRIQ